jgi:hypothetical protein
MTTAPKALIACLNKTEVLKIVKRSRWLRSFYIFTAKNNMPFKRLLVLCIILLQQIITQAQVDKSTQQKPSKVHIEFTNALVNRFYSAGFNPDSLIKQNKVKSISWAFEKPDLSGRNPKKTINLDKEGNIKTFTEKESMGLIRDTFFYNKSGQISKKITKIVDSLGNKMLVTNEFGGKTDSLIEEFYYDSIGQISQIFIVDSIKRISNEFTFANEEKYVVLNSYNKVGKRSSQSKMTYDENYQFIKLENNSYDNNGHLIKANTINLSNNYNAKQQLQSTFIELQMESKNYTLITNYLYYVNGLINKVISDGNNPIFVYRYEYY